MSKDNKILIIILIVIVAIITFFIVKDISKEENTFTFKETIIVQNQTEYKVEKYTKIILEKILDVDSIKVMFLNSRLNFNLSDSEVKGYIMNTIDPNTYLIFITKDFRQQDLKVLLSHELIHLKQMREGRLIQLDSITILWENKDTINFNNVPYDNRPNEIEAFNKQNEVRRELQKLLYD